MSMTWRRLSTAGVMQQWRPRLEVNREVRQFGVAVPGGVEHVGLRARTLHETGNWLVLTDCSNAFNTVKRTAVLAGQLRPALAPLVAKCNDTRRTDVFFSDGLWEDQDDRVVQRCPSGRRHGAGNVMSGVTTGDEAFPRGI